ncbi:uncharacterized protein BJ212DRAFT_1301294 [Suillus subaureus]|uniref:Uncharacterized protein n=1 Tax=Suillus subaureus TaxID=48587 RepID=A0A9P7E6R9_9AGAM|nr:uncharacterized protein BJ212DRAFT_1301294 [Suillus subaureus]KAG1812808.1 hypothetical protein BJ212DRAFT_1301294 [Suillus subaureus]
MAPAQKFVAASLQRMATKTFYPHLSGLSANSQVLVESSFRQTGQNPLVMREIGEIRFAVGNHEDLGWKTRYGELIIHAKAKDRLVFKCSKFFETARETMDV